MGREQKETRQARRSLAGVFHQQKVGNWARRERKPLEQFVQKGQEDSVNYYKRRQPGKEAYSWRSWSKRVIFSPGARKHEHFYRGSREEKSKSLNYPLEKNKKTKTENKNKPTKPVEFGRRGRDFQD